MNSEIMLERFLEQSPPDRVIMLLISCFELTIVARDIYSGQLDDREKLKCAAGILEICHKIIPNVISRIRNDESRFPDDVFVAVLWELFGKYDLDKYLPAIWDQAATKARRGG